MVKYPILTCFLSGGGLTRELQHHRRGKLKIRGVCDSLCIQRIVWENHRWVTIWFEINFPTSNHGLLSMLKCVANLSLVPILKSAWRRLVKLFETVKITETKRRQNGLKIGPRCGHVWLTSYPGPRGFSCLFAALVLSSYAEKNQENLWDRSTYESIFYL